MVLRPIDARVLQADSAALDRALHADGLRRVPMAGDGNCQFRALAHFFRDLNAQALRRDVVHFIWRERERFKWDICAEYDAQDADSMLSIVQAYCRAMARDGYWGDGITLQAFGLLYNVNVYLYTPKGRSNLHEIEGGQNIAIARNGEHYDAAEPF